MALSGFPELAILDETMSEMDGITAAREIRKNLKIPIVHQTNTCNSATAKRAAKSGIVAFLTKPLRLQDLLPTLEIALARADEVEELKERIEDLKETIENRKIIATAKGSLMERDHLRS